MKKTIFTIITVILFTISRAQPPNSLIAHYPLNNNTNDIGPSGNNGIITGSYEFIKDKNNNNNQALQFKKSQGFTGYMDANLTGIIDSQFTISFWLKPIDSLTGIAKIINVGRTALGDPLWSIEQRNYGNGKINLSVYAYADKDFIDYSVVDSELDSNVWQFITVTFKAGDSLISYVNGNRKSSKQFSFPSLTGIATNMRFGHAIETYSNALNPFDNFQLYNRALTSLEVLNLYSENALSVSSNHFKHQIKAYPNPSNSIVYIEGMDLNKKKIELMNLNGKVLNANVNDNTIDILNIENGIYFIVIKSDNGEIETVEKIIKN